MKKQQDLFSKQSDFYKKYRPTYPLDLYKDLLKLTIGRDACWDCGTGNGQVATVLSKHFKKVYATDISVKQILNSDKKSNIFYSVGRAESTSFVDDQFDLITVAQAIHWFDFEAFNKEVKRVAKDGALLAVWGYGLMHIEKNIDRSIREFYTEVVGPYWDKERQYIDDAYQSIPLDFKEITMNKSYFIKVNWTLGELEGYLNSWSSVQHFINKNGVNPIPPLMEKLKEDWGQHTTKEVNFPIFTRLGRITK